MTKNDWRIVAGVTLTIAAMIGLYAAIIVPKQRRADRLHASLPSVHAGMTEAEVLAMTGQPDQILQCRQASESCKYLYYYDIPLEIAGEEWWVRFDNQGHVVHTTMRASQ